MIALSVSDISLTFGTDTVLSGVSFAVNDGDRVGVIGVNGAGKTSLFKIITGEYEPDTGAVYIQKGHMRNSNKLPTPEQLLPPQSI